MYLALALCKRVMLRTASSAEVDEALAELGPARASLPPGDIRVAVVDLHEGLTRGTRYLAYAGRTRGPAVGTGGPAPCPAPPAVWRPSLP